jgi:hypothetical protein
MTLTVSPQIKIFALVAILGAVGLGGGLMLLGHGSGSAAAPKVIKPLHPVHKLHAPATPAKPVVKAKPAAHAVKAAPKPKRAATVTTPTASPPAVAPNGLPGAIDAALRRNPVVVVSLYDPQADVDAASVGEAAAGAKLAGAGFVALNVMSQQQALALTKKLGVLPDPALLVYRRPGDLVTRINGFADRETVAQAAKNAKP